MIKGDHDLPQTGKGVGHARTPRDRAGLEAAGAGLSSARRVQQGIAGKSLLDSTAHVPLAVTGQTGSHLACKAMKSTVEASTRNATSIPAESGRPGGILFWTP